MVEAQPPAAVVAPPPPPKPPARSQHNESRYRSYKTVAQEFVEGDIYDPNEIANMFHDMRWDEVPRAWAVALHNAARRGPIRSDIGESFRGLAALSVFHAFAATERLAVQPWVLQNWDFFFVAVADGLLLLNQKNSTLRSRVDSLRQSIWALFAMVEAARTYMSLDSAAKSTGIHAFLAATTSSKACFIMNGICQIWGESSGSEQEYTPAARRELTLAHAVLVDLIAEAILKEPSRDITTWNHAFGFYVGSDAWRGFANRCYQYMPFRAYTKHVHALENTIELGHERLNARAIALKQRLHYENAMRATNTSAVAAKKNRCVIIDIQSSDDEQETACDPHDLADAVMAKVPNPLSADGSVSRERLMEQCVAFLNARNDVLEREKLVQNGTRKNELAALRRCTASPPEMVPDHLAPQAHRRTVAAPRRQVTPESKSRPVAARKRKINGEKEEEEKPKLMRVLDPQSKPASPPRDADNPPPPPVPVRGRRSEQLTDPLVRVRLTGAFDIAALEGSVAA